MSENTAYVLMGYGPSDGYENWWAPVAVYTDMDQARAAKAEAKKRIPALELTIETVPLALELRATTDVGQIWEAEVGWSTDGTWRYEVEPEPLEGDLLADRTCEPFSLADLVAEDDLDQVDAWDRVRVIATDKEDARKRMRTIVQAHVSKEAGTSARYAE